MMKKGVIIASLGILAICSVFAFKAYTPAPATINNVSAQADIKVVYDNKLDANTSKKESIEAYYLDYEQSLDELKEKTDLIVIGKVTEQFEYGEVGVKNVITVTQKLKGKSADTIYVVKAGALADEEYILKKDNEYILLLGEVENSEDTYYIKGGEQGCFLIADNMLSAKDSVMKKDLEKLTKKAKDKKEKFNIVVEYLKK